MSEPETLAISPLNTKKRGEPTHAFPLPSDLPSLAGRTAEKLRWMRVNGSGNEPGLRDGDVVVLELGNEVVDGVMHAVAGDDGAVLRKIHARTSGGFTLSTDGDAKVFETVTKVPVIGVVLCRIGAP